ncbi:hypothetical protein [Anaerocolumna chitinilytica]|uniref:Core-binding (CB) domain-containing protein n=1 Tax=Anaerocolumna chitinilytica TaxID=1727145 RepID=A0A7M3SA05_9FIRM|nr:hypothetical protein [Anaerocolumna chitinilytica]BCK01423.1 hypothetical protein bsdcttw_44630 [Anaerocolumna chitinilytica]
MYTFWNTIEMFLQSQTEDSAKEYKPKIESFYQFLTEERKINDNTYNNYLSSVKVDDIIDALDYFINQNKVTRETVARYYCSVIKNYIKYLKSVDITNNKIIESFGLDSDDPQSFMHLINKTISKDKRLSKPDKKLPYELSELEIVIEECDSNIDDLCNIKTDKINENTFDKLVYLLCIKIMIFTGAKPSVVYNLGLNSENIKENKLDINGFILHTPNVLSRQLKKYLNIRESIVSKSSNLFIMHDGSNLDRSTYTINSFVKNIVGRGDTWGIVKYTVIQMIKEGINYSVIIKLTGIGNDIYDFCQEIVNEQKKITVNSYIDSGLIKLHFYDKL